MSFEPLTPERRRAMTRRHLLDAAAIVFAEKGFHGASLDEVAATAGFTKGAVYSNFKSKDDLFLALLDDRVDRFMSPVEELLEREETPEEQLPQIRDLIGAPGAWDEPWSILFYEFLLYALRNSEARVKLAAQSRRIRQGIADMIEREYERIGVESRYPIPALAILSNALFEGLAQQRLIEPAAVDDAMMSTALEFMYEAFGAGEIARADEPG